MKTIVDLLASQTTYAVVQGIGVRLYMYEKTFRVVKAKNGVGQYNFEVYEGESETEAVQAFIDADDL